MDHELPAAPLPSSSPESPFASAGADLFPLRSAAVQAPSSACMCRACWRDVTWNGEQLCSCLSLVQIFMCLICGIMQACITAGLFFFPCPVVDMRKCFYPNVFPIFPSCSAHFYSCVFPKKSQLSMQECDSRRVAKAQKGIAFPSPS